MPSHLKKNSKSYPKGKPTTKDIGESIGLVQTIDKSYGTLPTNKNTNKALLNPKAIYIEEAS